MALTGEEVGWRVYCSVLVLLALYCVMWWRARSASVRVGWRTDGRRMRGCRQWLLMTGDCGLAGFT